MRRTGLLALLLLPAACRPEPEPPQETPARPSPAFATRREHALRIKPTALLAADLDGDGRPDLLATGAETGELLVWRGGAGALGEPDRTVKVGGWPLAPLAVPAAPGGRVLVSVASRERKELAFHDLFGADPEKPVLRIDLGSVPRALAVGDLARDGVPDVAVACDDGRLVVVAPDGARRDVQVAPGLPRCALVLADGGVLLGYQDRASLLLVDPVAPGEPRTEIPLAGTPRALREADLDGDGDLELVVAGGDASLWVFGFGEAGGADAWARAGAPAPLAWDAGAIPIDLAAADLDGDGRAELVWLDFHDLTWNVAGAFAQSGPGRRASGYAGQTPCALALIERTRDGRGDRRLDLAVACRDAQSLSTARGLGAEGFEAPRRVGVGRFPTALAAGDLDGDARPDLVVLESKDDTASVLLRRDGSFVRAAVLATGPDPRGASLADLDGDGRLDLALVADDPQGSRAEIRFGDGAGALASRPGADGPRVGKGVRALLALDLDRDGRADLAGADAEKGEVTLWRGVPGERGTFALGSPVALEVRDGPCALVPIELEAGATPALAVALGGPGARTGIALLGGSLWREIGRIETGGSPVGLAAADLDGDGRADLAALVLESPGASRAEVRAYLREPAIGPPAFRLAAAFPASTHPRSIAAGDLDGDGAPDLVVAAQFAHKVDFACARRDPFRFEVQDALGAGVGCMDAVLLDLDGDGKLDVAVANGHSDEVTLLLAR